MRLEGKVIAITGSGSGLGREAAMLFAEEGATIVASDVVPGRAEAVAKMITFARTSIIFPTDLGQSDDIRSGTIPEDYRQQIER